MLSFPQGAVIMKNDCPDIVFIISQKWMEYSIIGGFTLTVSCVTWGNGGVI